MMEVVDFPLCPQTRVGEGTACLERQVKREYPFLWYLFNNKNLRACCRALTQLNICTTHTLAMHSAECCKRFLRQV